MILCSVVTLGSNSNVRFRKCQLLTVVHLVVMMIIWTPFAFLQPANSSNFSFTNKTTSRHQVSNLINEKSSLFFFRVFQI